MEITEVRVKLVERSSERLRAFCSVTFDGDFVIRDLKVIDGVSGVFVAMPSRKLADRCTKCGSKNHLRARYCNDCGQRLNENRAPKDADGRAKLHADIAHPINADCRERIQTEVVKAYEQELENSKSPDYRPVSFDDFEDDYSDQSEDLMAKQVATGGEKPGEEEAFQESTQAGRERGRDRGRDRGGRKDRGAERSGQADKGAESLGDYNELIADLKREAAARQDDRRAGQGQYGRRDRQEVAAHTVPTDAPPDEADTGTPGEDQSDFGTGIEPPGQDRRSQNHRGHRQRDVRPRSDEPRTPDSRDERGTRRSDSDRRRDDQDRRDRQDTPAPVEAEKPEPPKPEPVQPEPAQTEARKSPPQEDDDFGAGLL